METKNDSSKLVSLLALAAGAAAMPQTSNADIIFTDLSSNPTALVGWGSGYNDSFIFTDNMPGNVQFGFQRGQFSTSGNSYYGGTYYFYRQYVIAGSMGGAAPAGLQAVGGVAAVLNAGNTWDALGAGLFYSAAMGIASAYYNPLTTIFDRNPTSGYDHKYLAWIFTDTSPGGGPRYGWIEFSMLMANFPVGPNVTIWGYAYDDSGGKPYMGQMPVPEPSSGAMMVLGALALGAKGLRSWRRNRTAACKS